MITALTRKQLQAYGMSKYHTQVMTKGLNPVSKQGNSYVYSLSDWIIAIRNYVQRPRLQQATKERLMEIITALLELLGNVIEAPFLESSDPELRSIVMQLTKAMAKTDASLAALKLDALEIQQRYDTSKSAVR